jgi:hypothetical protein
MSADDLSKSVPALHAHAASALHSMASTPATSSLMNSVIPTQQMIQIPTIPQISQIPQMQQLGQLPGLPGQPMSHVQLPHVPAVTQMSHVAASGQVPNALSEQHDPNGLPTTAVSREGQVMEPSMVQQPTWMATFWHNALNVPTDSVVSQLILLFFAHLSTRIDFLMEPLEISIPVLQHVYCSRLFFFLCVLFC